MEYQSPLDASVISNFLETIPHLDRIQAIRNAREKKDKLILNIWEKELSKLPKDLIQAQVLTADITGWEKYLRLCFEKEGDFYKRFGFEDWKVKFIGQMFDYMTEDEFKRSTGRGEYVSVKGNYFDYFTKAGRNPEIWMTRKKELDKNSLLVHSISSQSLVKAVRSGYLGRHGVSELAMCQDRIVYDRGYIVIFQAKDLIDADYPLLQINEDMRDSKILREWVLWSL